MASTDGTLPETGLHKGTNWWGAFVIGLAGTKIIASSAKQTRTIVIPIGAPQVVPTGVIVWPGLKLNRTAR